MGGGLNKDLAPLILYLLPREKGPLNDAWGMHPLFRLLADADAQDGTFAKAGPWRGTG